MVLAQTSIQMSLPIPEVAWSAFAPELLVAAVALVLLLIPIARSRQQIVAVPAALVGVAVGAWLVTEGTVLPGGVAITAAVVDGPGAQCR